MPEDRTLPRQPVLADFPLAPSHWRCNCNRINKAQDRACVDCGRTWRNRTMAVPAHNTTYTRDNLRPAFEATDWREYRKTATTMAVRIDGEFTVKTREGTLTCPDGYLAVDAHGWPYPIAADEFERIYEPVDG